MTESQIESARLLEETEEKCTLVDRDLQQLEEALADKKRELNILQSKYDKKKVERDQAYAVLQHAQR